LSASKWGSRRPTHQTLFLAFNSDVDQLLATSHKLPAGESTFLAMDSGAMRALRRHDVPFEMLDDWLDLDARQRILRQSIDLANTWFRPVEDAFTVSGQCWPAVDKHIMFDFWKEVVIQVELARAIKDRSVAEVYFVKHAGSAASVGFGPADTFGECLRVALPNALGIQGRGGVGRTGDPIAVRAVRKMSRSARAWRQLRSPLPGPSPVVFVASAGQESERITSIVRALAAKLDGRVLGVTLEPDRGLAAQAQRAWGVAVRPGPALYPGAGPRAFLRAIELLRAKTPDPTVRIALDACPFHFQYYAKKRWPRLVGNLQGWLDMWDRLEPGCVISAGPDTAQPQLPGLAARLRGLASLAVPHGALETRQVGFLGPATQLAANPLQAEGFVRSGVPVETILRVRDVVSPNEYAVADRASGDGPPPGRCIALLNPVSYAAEGRGLMDLYVTHGDQTQALWALDNLRSLPEGSISIKLHPGFPDLALLEANAPDLTDHLLPLTSDLATELDRHELVIGVNYIGSALFHVVAAGKPLILFWTSPLLRDPEVHPYSALIRRAGLVVPDEAQLRVAVSRFFSEEGFSEELRTRSQRFASKWLSDTGQPALSEVVSGLLATA
jgi:hypothetical protein